MRERKDTYYYKAKREHYRSRAAYKLLEIQERFAIFSGNERVLELGSSPGGWSQVITENTSGPVLSIDISRQEPIDGVDFIRGDIYSDRVENEIGSYAATKAGGCFDVILSDTMAKTSGISHRDHALSVELCQRVMLLCGRFLCHGGTVLLKQFQGDMTKGFVQQHKAGFNSARLTTSRATRQGSSEVFIIFAGFRKKRD